jgi:hypothetical protein
MGYNRILEKVKGKGIDTSAYGGQLLEIDSGLKESNDNETPKIPSPWLRDILGGSMN